MNHMEHDIHTFTGCAGAIVFLLDKDKPASVKRVDHGNAIAVHAGAHPSTLLVNRNVAFQIREEHLAPL
jgi:hypothetical protein